MMPARPPPKSGEPHASRSARLQLRCRFAYSVGGAPAGAAVSVSTDPRVLFAGPLSSVYSAIDIPMTTMARRAHTGPTFCATRADK
jgi:hypothetical protein